MIEALKQKATEDMNGFLERMLADNEAKIIVTAFEKSFGYSIFDGVDKVPESSRAMAQTMMDALAARFESSGEYIGYVNAKKLLASFEEGAPPVYSAGVRVDHGAPQRTFVHYEDDDPFAAPPPPPKILPSDVRYEDDDPFASGPSIVAAPPKAQEPVREAIPSPVVQPETVAVTEKLANIPEPEPIIPDPVQTATPEIEESIDPVERGMDDEEKAIAAEQKRLYDLTIAARNTEQPEYVGGVRKNAEAPSSEDADFQAGEPVLAPVPEFVEPQDEAPKFKYVNGVRMPIDIEPEPEADPADEPDFADNGDPEPEFADTVPAAPMDEPDFAGSMPAGEPEDPFQVDEPEFAEAAPAAPMEDEPEFAEPEPSSSMPVVLDEPVFDDPAPSEPEFADVVPATPVDEPEFAEPEFAAAPPADEPDIPEPDFPQAEASGGDDDPFANVNTVSLETIRKETAGFGSAADALQAVITKPRASDILKRMGHSNPIGKDKVMPALGKQA